MKTKQEQRQAIVKSLHLAWSSLESHLDWVDGKALRCKNRACPFKDGFGTPAFHRKAIREYAQIIKTLTDLL